MTAIRTERLELRPLRIDDGPALLPLIANWDVVRWLARVPWPYTAAHMDDYLARVTGDADSARVPLVIVLDDSPIGQIVVVGQSGGGQPDRDGGVGFWLGQPYWKRGYLSEALRALTEHEFASRPDVEAIHSGWFEGNAASARVHEKAGFCITGRRMHHCLAQQRDLPLVTATLTRARGRAVDTSAGNLNQKIIT